ncbi:MAG: AbrB/MazE/SpoVT family DNA-binding domain-containing protein [Methylocystis sp.]
MTSAAALSAEFRISIPKEICKARGWQVGQEFAFIPKASGVLLVPVPERHQLAGVAKGTEPEHFRDRKDRF